MAELQTTLPSTPPWVAAGMAQNKTDHWTEGVKLGMESQRMGLEKKRVSLDEQRLGLEKSWRDIQTQVMGLKLKHEQTVQSEFAQLGEYTILSKQNPNLSPPIFRTPEVQSAYDNWSRNSEVGKTREAVLNKQAENIATIGNYEELAPDFWLINKLPADSPDRSMLIANAMTKVKQLEDVRSTLLLKRKADIEAAPRKEIAAAQAASRKEVAQIQAQSREKIAETNRQKAVELQKAKPSALPQDVKESLSRAKKQYAGDTAGWEAEKNRILNDWQDKQAGLTPLPRNPYSEKVAKAEADMRNAEVALKKAPDVVTGAGKLVPGFARGALGVKPHMDYEKATAYEQKRKIYNDLKKAELQWDRDNKVDRNRKRPQQESSLSEEELQRMLAEWERDDLQAQMDEMTEWDPVTGEWVK